MISSGVDTGGELFFIHFLLHISVFGDLMLESFLQAPHDVQLEQSKKISAPLNTFGHSYHSV